MGNATEFGFEFLQEMMNISAMSAANALAILLGERVHVDLPEIIRSPDVASLTPREPATAPFCWRITWMSGPMLAATVSVADAASEHALLCLLPSPAERAADPNWQPDHPKAGFSVAADSMVDSQQRDLGQLTDDSLRRDTDESGSGDIGALWGRLLDHSDIAVGEAVAARSRIAWTTGRIDMLLFIKPPSGLDELAGSAMERAMRG